MKTARIIFNNENSSVDCTLRDISDSGAKVRVNGWFDVPQEVQLQIPEGVERFGQLADCNVVWHHGDLLGLAFAEA